MSTSTGIMLFMLFLMALYFSPSRTLFFLAFAIVGAVCFHIQNRGKE